MEFLDSSEEEDGESQNSEALTWKSATTKGQSPVQGHIMGSSTKHCSVIMCRYCIFIEVNLFKTKDLSVIKKNLLV